MIKLIMVAHSGEIEVENHNGDEALVRLIFPYTKKNNGSTFS